MPFAVQVLVSLSNVHPEVPPLLQGKHTKHALG